VRHVPAGQALRYLAVGAWNTLFGYGCYALLTYLLTGILPYAYMAAAVLSTVVNITVAYLGYKVFVFKTKGNYLREYLRWYVVYGTTTLVNLALLPLLVAALDVFVRPQSYAPYVAGAILTVGTVVASFFGHKRYSFAPKGVPEIAPASVAPGRGQAIESSSV
jgi:putative flippase GtrA